MSEIKEANTPGRQDSLPSPCQPLRGQQCVNVVSGSRVHFGLLSTTCEHAPSFGGCGVMVHRPSIWVQAVKAPAFSASHQYHERCQNVATQYAQHFQIDGLPKCEIRVQRVSQEHSGLGSGTQLSLAVAVAINALHGNSISDEDLTLQIASRGRRSAVGSYGFFRGGFIAETGAASSGKLGKLIQARSFPDQWPIVLVTASRFQQPVHGNVEDAQFDRLNRRTDRERSVLLGLLEDAIIPAITRHDYEALDATLGEYNYRSGMLFESSQGGAYNGPELCELVELMKRCGTQAVGQSSWGPTLFAVCRSRTHASEFVAQLHNALAGKKVNIQVTRARNKPARVCALSTVR